MIDLHSHILHGIDDGASDLKVALEMARIAADDGVEVMACTPHFLPGVYEPAVHVVMSRVAELNDRLMDEGIGLVVVSGCEAHVRADMVERLQSAQILTIHSGRYVLCEAPPDVLPPHMDRLFMNIMAAGYIPILAHAERYSWIDRALPWIERMSHSGVLMQVTAGSFLGDFGRRAQDWSMRLLLAGLVSIVASDAHDTARRPPGLSKARRLVKAEVGEQEARRIFDETPELIVLDEITGASGLRTSH
jgi:protein-tyrosine phosphatase